MKALTTFCVIAFTFATAGCAARQSPDSDPPRHALAGTWVSEDSENDALAVMIFEPDQTGGISMQEGPVVLGALFVYERHDDTIVMTPDGAPEGTRLDIHIDGETLNMESPDGTPLIFRRSDDPRYRLHVDELRWELENRGEQ